VLKVVSQKWAETDFGCKGGGERCTFYIIIRSIDCDVDVEELMGGLKTRFWLGTLAPLHFNHC